jgi:hypothetical protein
MDAFGGNDEESAELKKLNVEVVRESTNSLRWSCTVLMMACS